MQRIRRVVDAQYVEYLDPTLDVVFRLLLTREPRLLRDMLEAVLGRGVHVVDIIDPELAGGRAIDKRVHFDVRVLLSDGTRVDVEMQRRNTLALISRLIYYVARDFAGQLNRGDSYHLLTPTVGITWLVEPLVPSVARLHSIFELRDRHQGVRLSEHLAIHLLQLPYRTAYPSTGYTRRVDRWARFFTAHSDAEFAALSAENPIMSLATQTLAQLSQDPEARRRAREREDEFKLRQIDLAVSRAEGEAKGKREFLLRVLGLRFGPLPEEIEARLAVASLEQLDRWVDRVVTARSIHGVFAS